MNFIMKGIHTALEPLRYAPSVTTYHQDDLGNADARGFIESIKYRRRVRRAIRELSKLSNETLKDIGVERGNIPEIVAETMRKSALAHVTDRCRTAPHYRDVSLSY